MTSDDGNENESKSGFLRTVLTGLVETIADMDEGDRRRGVGSTREGRKRFDYGFDIGIGPGTDSSGRKQLADSEPETDPAAAVQPTEGGYVATVDLPDVDPHELSAGVDDTTLLIADESGVVGRISLPHGDLEVGTAAYNNGVLDVRLDATGGNE